MISIIAFTRKGCALGRLLADRLGGTLYAPERFAAEYSAQPYGELSRWTEAQFAQKNALIFVSAAGIAVRSIAPFVRDKLTDPAVLSLDEQGQYVIPLLSGHVGGGNDLARRVSEITEGTPVLSTATDLNGRFAVDVWARENRLVIAERERIKQISAAILEGEPVGFRSEVPASGPLPQGVTEEDCALGFCVSARTDCNPFPVTLHLLPRTLTVGIGCKRGTGRAHLEQILTQVFQEYRLDLRRVSRLSTISLKQDESGLLELCEAHGWPLVFYTAEELALAEGTFAASDFVRKTTGVDNVCERAAVRAGGSLLVPKQAREGVTIAVAETAFGLRFEQR